MPTFHVLKSALRGLSRSPRLAIAAVLCIGLGTAATSAVATLVSAALVRPLPFPEAERLVRIWLEVPDSQPRMELSYPDLRDLQGSLRTVDRVEGLVRARPIVFDDEGGRRVEGEAVTEGYFDLLGVEPFVGRLFDRGDHRPDAERVVVLAHSAWGEMFAYDPQVVGRTISTDMGPFAVAGVLPPSFTGTVEEDSGDLELWFPVDQYVPAERRERRDVAGVWTVARLAPGASLEAASAELEALGRRFAELYPESHGDRIFSVEPMGESWRAELRRGSYLLAGASGLLLLVAALNVMALLLARSVVRRRELAIRSALGAGRGRLMRQSLTETLLLVGAGGLLGLAAGPPLLRAFLEISTVRLPQYVDARPDALALAVSFGVVAVAALVAGLAPAFLGARTDLTETLGEGGRGAAGGRTLRRWGAGLVFAEVALTMVLVVAASFMIRTYRALATEELGYDADRAVRTALFIEAGDVPPEGDPRPLYDRLLREVAAEPGVERVGLVFPTVPIVRPIVFPVRWSGMPETLSESGVRVGYFSADAGFFEALRVPLVAGRGFLPSDDDDSVPVALVSESLARRIAPDGEPADAVGREVRIGPLEPEPPRPVRIAGVVGDVRFGGPREDEAHAYEIYRPLSQDPRRLVSVTVRAGGDPEALVEPVRRRVAAVAPASAIDWNETFGGLFRSYFWADTRFFLSLVGIFSGIGLLLSAVGLYAVLADGVARGRREIGIRQALGATPGSVLVRVLGRGLGTVAAGLAAGSLVAWSVSESLGALAYGVAPSDPGPYAAAGATLLAVAFAACWLPARRAAKVTPMEALREE